MHSPIAQGGVRGALRLFPNDRRSTPQQFAKIFSSQIARDTILASPNSICKSDPQPATHQSQTRPASSPAPPPKPKAPAPTTPIFSTTSPTSQKEAASFPPPLDPLLAA